MTVARATPPPSPEALARAARIADAEAFATLSRAGVAMVLADATLPDMPLVYVNEAFERVTGYPATEALGRNCRFLQGETTDPDHRAALREAIREGRETTVDILNHRADGTPFLNRLLIAPVTDDAGRVTHYLGVQKALSAEEMRRSGGVTREEALREMHHRVKNHLAMVVSMIRLEARARDPEGYARVARRVESLQLLYEELNQAGRGGFGERIALGPYLERIARAVAQLDGRAGLRLDLALAPLVAPVETAGRIGLVLSEILTNAFEHAFAGRESGRVAVSLAAQGDGARLVVEDDGVGLPAGVRWPDMGSLGGRIVQGLVEGMAARLDLATSPQGTRVAVEVPRLAA